MSREKIRLGPLPNADTVKVTITVSADLKALLDQYAELHAKTWGVVVDVPALIPHMLSTFMDRDRVFNVIRRKPDPSN